MDERESSRLVASQTMAAHREGLELLRSLANRANGEIAETHGIDIQNMAIQFRIAVLSQAINHAWKIGELIETGYCRVALSLARVLRESHIAVLWSIEDPDEAGKNFERARSNGSLERGHWPNAGKMVLQVSRALMRIGHSQAVDWDKVIRQYGDTHNQLFTHAVSDFSLTTSLLDSENFAPVVGPVYIPHLVELTIDHFVPLFIFLLNDATKVRGLLLSTTGSTETEALLERGGAWWQERPPVQLNL